MATGLWVISSLRKSILISCEIAIIFIILYEIVCVDDFMKFIKACIQVITFGHWKVIVHLFAIVKELFC